MKIIYGPHGLSLCIHLGTAADSRAVRSGLSDEETFTAQRGYGGVISNPSLGVTGPSIEAADDASRITSRITELGNSAEQKGKTWDVLIFTQCRFRRLAALHGILPKTLN